MTIAASSEAKRTLRVRVARKWSEAEDIAGIELVAVEGANLIPFEAGAHIDLHLPGGVIRSYSLCNNPAERHRYQLGVLREPASRGGSAAVHDLVLQDSLLTISEPRNFFPLVAGAKGHLLLAGGIGITPLMAMAETLLAQEQPFEFHVAARTEARTAFRQRIKGSGLSAFTHFHTDNGPPEQRLDLQSLLALPHGGRHLYVCGPSGFIEACFSTARRCGWPEAQLHCEHFGAVATPAAAGDLPFDVHLQRSGKTIPIAADQSIVAALEAAGVFVATSCEQGICGTCLTGVLEGDCDHRDQYLTPEEQAANDQMLPCVSRARSGRLVLDL